MRALCDPMRALWRLSLITLSMLSPWAPLQAGNPAGVGVVDAKELEPSRDPEAGPEGGGIIARTSSCVKKPKTSI